jgi:hypothetical protein
VKDEWVRELRLLMEDERNRGLALLLGGTFMLGATGYLRVPYAALAFMAGGLAVAWWGLALLLRPRRPTRLVVEAAPALGRGPVRRLGAASAPGGLGTEVDPQHEEPLLDGPGGVADHGEVLEVDLGPLHELPPGGPLEGRKGPVTDGLGPFPEAGDHGGDVELVSHGEEP